MDKACVHKSVSKVSKEPCPFCGEQQISQNLERHVVYHCLQAKIPCGNKDILNELMRIKAKQKGLVDKRSMFEKTTQKK